MCACEFNFICSRCRERWPLDLDPAHTDWCEDEQEARELLISRPDFEAPLGAVA